MSAALTPSLEFAVMLNILEFKRIGYISDAVIEDALLTADLIAHSGDVLLYGGDESAKIFNKVARAIAVLSFQPGGFSGLGMKFEASLNIP